jgi:hypothetical protein
MTILSVVVAHMPKKINWVNPGFLFNLSQIQMAEKGLII